MYMKQCKVLEVRFMRTMVMPHKRQGEAVKPFYNMNYSDREKRMKELLNNNDSSSKVEDRRAVLLHLREKTR